MSSFAAVTEATNRVDDFSSNLCGLVLSHRCGTPGVLPFDVASMSALATGGSAAHTSASQRRVPGARGAPDGWPSPEIEDLAVPAHDEALSRARVEFMETSPTRSRSAS